MERRHFLQAGASLVALPLIGCGAGAEQAPAMPSEGPPAPAHPPSPAPAPDPAPAPAPAAAPTPAPAVQTAPAAPDWGRVVTRVGRNHGHVLTVSLDDVKAGVEKTYDLAGTAGHGHAVKLAPEDFKRLHAGEIVRMPSSRDGGHAHRVYVRCAPAVDPPEAISVCAVEIGGKDDHELIINAADMAAKADRTYDIQGVAGHTHAVQVAADDFTRLAKGEEVVLKTSPGDGHFHFVYVRYPARPKAG